MSQTIVQNGGAMEALPHIAPEAPWSRPFAVGLAWTEAALAAMIALASLADALGPRSVSVLTDIAVAVVGGLLALALGWGATVIRSPGWWAASCDSTQPWGPMQIFLGVVGGFAGGILLGEIATGVGALVAPHPSAAATTLIAFVSQIALYAGTLGNIYVFALAPHRSKLADLGWRKPRSIGPINGWAWIPLGAAVGGVALFVGFVLSFVVEQFAPNVVNPQCQDFHNAYGHYLAIAILVVSVIAPIAEETIFRGFIYRGLARRWGPVWAVLLSGVIFALFHATPILVIPLAGVGMVLALSYELSDSLYPGMVAHGLFNLLPIIAIIQSGCS